MAKTLMVTGGSRGIGRAIALKFAALGYDVALTYVCAEDAARQVAAQIEAHGRQALMLQADFSYPLEIAAMFKRIDECFGRLDVLVNNAGWTRYIEQDDFENLTDQLFDKILSINLKSVYTCTRHAILRMNGSEHTIINIASVAGISGMGSNIAYCAAKAGVIAMTKALARALAPRIRVNAIAPGLTDTDMTSGAPASYRNDTIITTPLARLVSAKDVADLAFALANETRFVNGQTIVVDGGRLL